MWSTVCLIKDDCVAKNGLGNGRSSEKAAGGDSILACAMRARRVAARQRAKTATRQRPNSDSRTGRPPSAAQPPRPTGITRLSVRCPHRSGAGGPGHQKRTRPGCRAPRRYISERPPAEIFNEMFPGSDGPKYIIEIFRESVCSVVKTTMRTNVVAFDVAVDILRP